MKNILIGSGLLIVLGGGFYALNAYIYSEKQANPDYGKSPKDTTYVIDGTAVTLVDGVSELEAAPGTASKIITRYFGNDVTLDLDDDGREDTVFLITQETGGSGTFFYVVAALNKESGYEGSQALLLGDRIAPQAAEKGSGKVVIVNYAVRTPGEDFSVQPSVGKSIWLLLDPMSMQFGEVVQDFEGEADPTKMTLGMKTWGWMAALYNDGTALTPKKKDAFTLTFGNDGRFSASTDCNQMSGRYTRDGSKLVFGPIASTKMFCEGSQEGDFAKLLENASSFHFTSRGELILDLKFDSGTATFR